MYKSKYTGQEIEDILDKANEGYELPEATTTALGGVKLASNAAVNTTPTITSTAGRYYGVRKNSAGQLMVNVPWVNTTYSVVTTSSSGLVPRLPTENMIVGDTPPACQILTGDGKWKALFMGWNPTDGVVNLNIMDDSFGYGGASCTIPAATTALPGLMLAADKTKLDGIEEGANNYVLPEATKTELGGVRLANNARLIQTPNLSTATGRYYGVIMNHEGKLMVNVPWTNTTYSNATTSTAGLMSAADKTKVDEIMAPVVYTADSEGEIVIRAPTNGRPIIVVAENTDEYWIYAVMVICNGDFALYNYISSQASPESKGDMYIDIDDDGTVHVNYCTKATVYFL